MEKDHAAGARCTGGNPLAVPLDAIYMQKAAGKRNRQIHKAAINKGGKRNLNQSPKYAFGFQLFDRVQMPDGRRGVIFGRRLSGSFDVRALDGAKLFAGAGCKKLKPLEKRKAILTERGVRLPPQPKGRGICRITTVKIENVNINRHEKCCVQNISTSKALSESGTGLTILELNYTAFHINPYEALLHH
ncbi:MAG: hypothetical protein LBU32_16435 [Clostridiales bacterium]|nr:hypothetical protein [Clostridiales bacterium]